jgi:homopolymeric O-antigen transport system permease protein
MIYTPESALRHPGKLAREMVADLLASRELAWRLFTRDIRAQYRQSILGYVWVFIPPLVAALPFIYLNSQGIIGMGKTPIPYGAYAMVGTIIWQTFVDALNSPLRALSSARGMLTRINFPREAPLLAGVAQVGFGLLVRLVLLAGIFAWFRITPPPTALLFPVGILGLIVVGFMVGLILTPIALLYGDVQQALGIATGFLMLLTPVLYPVPHSGIAATIAALNPLTPLITTTRGWLAIGAAEQAGAFAGIVAAAIVLLLVGWIAYRVTLPHLIARFGN